MNLDVWRLLIRMQLRIAERWFDRGKKAEDIFAKFFFYFTGFNALYFLWRKIDDISGNERNHIENLLKKFYIQEAQTILEEIRNDVDYFCKRPPIQRMDKRTSERPLEGNFSDGKK